MVNDLKNALEKGTNEEKADALKKLIMFTLNGEPMPQLLMVIIRFVMPSQDHTIKKLLLLYWEVVDKTTADGKLKSEMILVWYALYLLLNCISHPIPVMHSAMI